MLHVEALDHIVLNVADVERSLAWYVEQLGLEGVRVEEWRAGEAPFPSVRISADSLIDLVQGDRPGENLDHFCLVVTPNDLDAVRNSDGFEIAIDDGKKRYGARGWADGLYVRDPDGNVIELRAY